MMDEKCPKCNHILKQEDYYLGEGGYSWCETTYICSHCKTTYEQHDLQYWDELHGQQDESGAE
jgi:hypothetical protein